MLQDMQQTRFGSEEVSKIGFINFIKGVYKRLFPIKNIQTALNIKPAISKEMLDCIRVWQDCYSGRSYWVDKDVKSLKLEQSITREFSNTVVNEMTASVTVPKLDHIFQKAKRNIGIYLQRGLATGAMVIKPIGGDRVQYVAANAFIPVEYDSGGRLIKVIFPEFKRIGDNYYTRLEYHDFDYENGLIITNKSYVSNNANTLGEEIPIFYVDEWKNLAPFTSYPMMNRPAFGYYRNPIDNKIDGSHCGVSIFDSAIDLIRLADIQFSRLDWEFESGERTVLIDQSALEPIRTIEGLKKFEMPKLNERLYKGINLSEGSNGEDFYKEFSPQFRQADIISGLEEYKRNIEFAVGLAYGDLSNPQFVDKTATEVLASKQRKYNTVTAIQENLKDCLDDLVYALAFYNSMTKSGYKFNCDFKDSILTDEREERKQDQQDLANGTLRPDEYRSKWRGEDIETARENLPQTAQVID